MKSKTKKWKIIVPLLVLFAIIGLLIPKEKEATAEVPTGLETPEVSWQFKTYEERQQWIENYLKKPDDAGYTASSKMEEVIKSKFNYPEEVKFKDRPTFTRAQVTDANEGMVHVFGEVTGKNTFGVKQLYSYQCRLTVVPGTISLDEVIVAER